MAEYFYPLALLIFVPIAGLAVEWNVDNWHCAGASGELNQRWWVVPLLTALGFVVIAFAASEVHQLIGVTIVLVSMLSLGGLALCAAVGNACIPARGFIRVVLNTDSEPACAALRTPTDPPRPAGRQARGTPQFGAPGVTI